MTDQTAEQQQGGLGPEADTYNPNGKDTSVPSTNPCDYCVVSYTNPQENFVSTCIVPKKQYALWRERYDKGTVDFPVSLFCGFYNPFIVSFRNVFQQIQCFDKPADVIIWHRMFGRDWNRYPQWTHNILRYIEAGWALHGGEGDEKASICTETTTVESYEVLSHTDLVHS